MHPYEARTAHVRPLAPADFDALYRTFCGAFEGYPAAIRMDKRYFGYRQQRVGTDYALSAAAFDRSRMVGFILTGTGDFEGAPTAYNAGTGVLPDARGRKLTYAMYETLFPAFKTAGLRQCLLEVMDGNAPALRAYRDCGFAKTRMLYSYALAKPLPERTCRLPVRLSIVESPDWLLYRSFGLSAPDWQNSPARLGHVAERITTVEAVQAGQTIGFVAFEKGEGRIAALAVEATHRRKGLGNALLRSAAGLSKKKLAFYNLDAQSEAADAFLRASGFRKVLTQWEMRRSI